MEREICYAAEDRIVLRREQDDWALLFDPDTGKAFGIDPVGIFLWERLARPVTVENLVACLRESFASVPPEADAHVRAFVEGLDGKGLIRRLQAGGPVP